jgi:hypothetical protein
MFPLQLFRGHRKPSWASFFAAFFAVWMGFSESDAASPTGPAKKRILTKRADIMACSDVIQTGASPLMVQAPLLRYTITSFDPNWFNPNGSQQGAPLFTLRIASQLLAYADRLTLRVHAWADTSLASGNPLSSPIEVFDRTTVPLSDAFVGVPLTSGQIFGLDFQSGGGTDFRNSDLYAMTVERREVPQMNLHLEFALYCSGAPVAENGVNVRFETTAKVRYVRTVRALSPGTDVGASRPASIYTLSPVFQISSDLLNDKTFEYAPGESRLEIFLYELEEGQNPKDAFRGLEFARFPADQFPAVYPAHLPALQPGRRYAWRVRALLRGPESRYTYSNGLYFLVDPRLDNSSGGASGAASSGILSEPADIPQQTRYGDEYPARVLAALKMILGPNYDIVAGSGGSGKDKVPAQGLIRLNGQPYSLEELEKLAKGFGAGRHRVTKVKFE